LTGAREHRTAQTYMSSRSARLIQALLAVAALAVFAFALASRPAEDRPIPISTARVVRQTISSVIATNGKVEPIEPHIIQAQLTTFVDTVLAKDGQTVSRGQLLLTLDATQVLSDLAHTREQLVAAGDERRMATRGGSLDERAAVEADLAKTNAEVARLRSEGESLKRLYARQAATRDELEQNRTALEKAEADEKLAEQRQLAMAQRSQVQGDRAVLREAEARNLIHSLEQKVKSARVVAPVTGVLYSLSARPGTLVQTGDVLGELADLTRVRARVFVDEPDLGSVKEGQQVDIRWDALPNRTWTGRVERLPKTIVARGSRNVGEVLCSVQNDKAELLPNTNIDARILTAQHENALTVPRAALRTEGVRRYVFALLAGRLRKREVAVGMSNATHSEILSGLAENDLVAISGTADLHDGQAVTTTGKQ
jgi:RND family efflux transporter MFP subunit